MCRSGFKHETLVAIGTFHEILIPHFQVDAGMAKRPTAAIAGDAGIVGFDDFGGQGGHGKVPDWRDGRDHSQVAPRCNWMMRYAAANMTPFLTSRARFTQKISATIGYPRKSRSVK